MKQNFVKILSTGLLACTVWSCSFLDVSDELAGGISDISQVFSNVDRTKKWYSQVFNNRPDYSAVWVTDSPMGNPWTSYSDEIYTRLANNAGKYTEWNSSNSNSQRWNTLYGSIRQANIFLEQAHPIVDEGGPDADRLTEEEIKLYKANVRFMRAAYHYYLMELYGPIPIVDHSMTLEDDLDLPRNSLDEVIEFIDRKLKECMEEMAQEPYHDNENLRAVPTKGAALALRAKLWVYAASPLFNGGWPEALALTNKDGKRLEAANGGGPSARLPRLRRAGQPLRTAQHGQPGRRPLQTVPGIQQGDHLGHLDQFVGQAGRTEIRHLRNPALAASGSGRIPRPARAGR